jgi:2-C-methyl-D-erythritol 2,4-cyclodiphosphate synthase
MMREIRTGFGYDAHRFGGDGPLTLAGVSIAHAVGVLGTSDGDVATHAVCDALLGAVAAGDLGTFFPSSDAQWKGVDSLQLLKSCTAVVTDTDYAIGSIDLTIVVQSVRVAPHREQMRSRLADAMDIDVDIVSVKATTTDGLGWIGTDAGLAAHAVATVYR